MMTYDAEKHIKMFELLTTPMNLIHLKTKLKLKSSLDTLSIVNYWKNRHYVSIESGIRTTITAKKYPTKGIILKNLGITKPCSFCKKEEIVKKFNKRYYCNSCRIDHIKEKEQDHQAVAVYHKNKQCKKCFGKLQLDRSYYPCHTCMPNLPQDTEYLYCSD